MSSLTDKEVFILDQISKKSSISQRYLAKKTGVSLGLINVILKKFIEAHYIKVVHLGKRKMEYLLTPLGFLETAKRTYNYATNTVRNYKGLKSNLATLLKDLYSSGYDYFSISGDGELRELIESTFFRHLNEVPVTLGKDHRDHPRAVVLNVTTDSIDSGFKGDVVNVLAKIGV